MFPVSYSTEITFRRFRGVSVSAHSLITVKLHIRTVREPWNFISVPFQNRENSYRAVREPWNFISVPFENRENSYPYRFRTVSVFVQHRPRIRTMILFFPVPWTFSESGTVKSPGIKQEITSAMSSEQNGVVGRGLAFIKTSAMAARIEAGEPYPEIEIPSLTLHITGYSWDRWWTLESVMSVFSRFSR